MSATAATEITIRCQDCEWSFAGLGAEARAQWMEHRYQEHDDYQQPPKGDPVEAIKAIPARPVEAEIPEESGASVNDPAVPDSFLNGSGKGAARPKGYWTAERYSFLNGSGKGAARPKGYWTAERCLDAIRAFHAEHGRTPTQPELRAPLPSNSVLVKHFGSMGKAVEAAGFEARAKGGGRPRTKSGPDRKAAETEPRPVAPPDTPAPPPDTKTAPPDISQQPSLVELAQAVDNLSTRRRAMLAELDALEAELREAVDALQDAVRPLALEGAA